MCTDELLIVLQASGCDLRTSIASHMTHACLQLSMHTIRKTVHNSVRRHCQHAIAALLACTFEILSATILQVVSLEPHAHKAQITTNSR